MRRILWSVPIAIALLNSGMARAGMPSIPPPPRPAPPPPPRPPVMRPPAIRPAAPAVPHPAAPQPVSPAKLPIKPPAKPEASPVHPGNVPHPTPADTNHGHASPPRPTITPIRLPRRAITGRTYSYKGRLLRPFLVPRYRWPRGHHFHRYGVGMILPPLFLVTDYLIDDWGDFGLDAPPPGFAWYRYGPDLLLVNPETGYIQSVIFNAFADVDGAAASTDAASANNGPSLDETLAFIRFGFLTASGAKTTAPARPGHPEVSFESPKFHNVKYAQCTMDASYYDHGETYFHIDFQNIKEIDTAPADQFLSGLAKHLGTRLSGKASPPGVVLTIRQTMKGAPHNILSLPLLFYDASLADHMTKAIAHTVYLCGR